MPAAHPYSVRLGCRDLSGAYTHALHGLYASMLGDRCVRGHSVRLMSSYVLIGMTGALSDADGGDAGMLIAVPLGQSLCLSGLYVLGQP